MLRITSHRGRRSRITAMAVVSGTAGAVLVWSPGAFAAAGCTTTTPSIGQTIVCNAAGTESITVPDGADAMEVVVIGGGGGGGGSSAGRTGGAGGQGAFVGASLLLPGGTSVLDVKVGDGGDGQPTGGDGGDFSRLEAGGVLLAIAGGGGGGGFDDPTATGGDGSVGGNAAGGAGGNGVGATGGGGGANGSPGSGGTANDGTAGDPGRSYAAGGAGGPGDAGSGGDGGAGYGGGGGGGAQGGVGTTGGGGAGGSYVSDVYLVGSPFFMASVGPNGDGGSGGSGGGNGSAGAVGSITITFFIRSTPTPDSPTATAAPAMVLAFDLPEGVACNFDSVEASRGAWIELPTAGDCTITSRGGSEDPSLLGWATKEDFPVDIAERQVANNWGAYETFGDDGQLTGVFIPAGGYTAVTGDTNLYPIWSE